MGTAYHSQYWAHALILQGSGGNIESLSRSIANALCHRDYTIPGGAVAVAMYDDHLEITNPGDFHFGITPEKLTIPHESKPWNPIIANVLYRAGIIERSGVGTLNIIDWCAENANLVPVWQEQVGSVYVTFLPAVLPDIPEVTEEVEAYEAPVSGLFKAVSIPTDHEPTRSQGRYDAFIGAASAIYRDFVWKTMTN